MANFVSILIPLLLLGLLLRVMVLPIRLGWKLLQRKLRLYLPVAAQLHIRFHRALFSHQLCDGFDRRIPRPAGNRHSGRFAEASLREKARLSPGFPKRFTFPCTRAYGGRPS